MSATVLKFCGEAMTRREIEIARDCDAKARCAALHWATVSVRPVNALRPFVSQDHRGHANAPCEECAEKASERYPLPTITRSRFLRDPHAFGAHNGWIVEDGVLLRCVLSISGKRDAVDLAHDTGTSNITWWQATAERVAVWSDLYITPDEEVDDE